MLDAVNIQIRNKILAKDLKTWLMNSHLAPFVQLFYNGYVYRYDIIEDQWTYTMGLFSEACPFATDDTVGLTFEGPLYDMLHVYPNPHPAVDPLGDIFEKHGFKYELVHTWAMSAVSVASE